MEQEEKSETTGREVAGTADNNQRGEWSAERITDEASQRSGDEIERQIRRGNEARGDADERDIAGASEFEDTPHGREEAKKNQVGKANNNG